MKQLKDFDALHLNAVSGEEETSSVVQKVQSNPQKNMLIECMIARGLSDVTMFIACPQDFWTSEHELLRLDRSRQVEHDSAEDHGDGDEDEELEIEIDRVDVIKMKAVYEAKRERNGATEG